MDSFAFIIHPIDPKRDVSRKYPLLGQIFSEALINYGSTFFPPVLLSQVNGIKSKLTGKVIKGWLIACPLTAARMLELNQRIAYRKIIQTGHLAERLGANLLGLGAFTSVVGDGGLTVANSLDIPVTTGDAYTISVAVQAIRKERSAGGAQARAQPPRAGVDPGCTPSGLSNKHPAGGMGRGGVQRPTHSC